MPGRLHKILLLGLALLLLTAATVIQRQLNHQRASLGLTRMAPLENAPPVLAFTTVALGGFRGLIANALWIRANDLQLEDKFFEQVQLSDWITKLEPTFVQVWVLQAWNMAFNISVKFRDPYDRWRWVQRGIELLRDEGLRYNPNEALIYRELAWFFQFKMGQNLDDAHLVYKDEWAREMTRLFDGPKPNYEELIHPQTPPARERARLLVEKYKMNPRTMQQIDQLYGTLEWRLPEASAIYWAHVGLEKSKKKELIVLRRVIYQCLQLSATRGRIIMRPDGSYSLAPDLQKIPLALEGFEKMLAEEKEKPEGVRTAQRNFLRQVVYTYYIYNRLNEAQHWLAVLKEKYPQAVPKDETLEQFGLRSFASILTEKNNNKTKMVLEGLLTQHFENLAIDETEHAAGFLNQAKQIWDLYDTSIRTREAPLKIDPLPEMYIRVRDAVLDRTNGLPFEYRARLRTVLQLPPETAPSTNAPPAPPAPPAKQSKNPP